MAKGKARKVNKLTAWLAVRAYRTVPACVRGHYPGFPVSTSHLFRWGMGWRDIVTLTVASGNPHKPMPGPYK